MSKTHCSLCKEPHGTKPLYCLGRRRVHQDCWLAYLKQRRDAETPDQRASRLKRMRDYARRKKAEGLK